MWMCVCVCVRPRSGIYSSPSLGHRNQGIMWQLFLQLIVVLAVVASVLSQNPVPGSDIQDVSNYTLLKTGKFGSKLYSLDAPNSSYADYPVKLIDLHGASYYAQGFDAAMLLADEMAENYNSLMVALLGSEWWEPAAAEVVGLFLDWQWNDYLSKQVPQDFMDEIAGLAAGGFAAGLKHDLGKMTSRGITLANLPSSLVNFKYVLIDEKNNPPAGGSSKIAMSVDDAMAIVEKLKSSWAGLTCSMFGVWGSRTENGHLYTGRNLDWLKDTGITQHKLVTVHHPPLKKGYAHATIGFAGLWGALTGMSAQGLTVHEANLESNDITYRGFPWVLRLRYVMTNAKNLDEALNIWAATNSTVGFNHGFGSANDGKAVVLETMMNSNAVFGANDEREKNYIYHDQQIGAPREEAVYRTNHGYDPYTIQHYMWNETHAMEDSIDRYLAFPEAFDSYAASKTAIGYVEAVNVT
jgi:hypothetical protein